MVIEITGGGAKLELIADVYQFTIAGAISDGGGGATEAVDVSITDAGGYYASTEVEGALQEVGADITAIEGDITALDGRVTTAEGDITALQSDVTALDGNITAINSTLAEYGDRFTSKQFASPMQTLTIALGLIAWDMTDGQRATVTLTASATLSNPINLQSAFPDLEVRQDAVGGRVLSFGSSYVTPLGYVPAPTTANSYTLYHFQLRSDGKLAVNYTHYTA